jgi:hypothetical protein
MEQPEAGVWPEKVPGPIGIEWESWHLEIVEFRRKPWWMAQNVAIDDAGPTFWLSGEQDAFKKLVSKTRLIKMRSKSESCEIRVESMEAKNRRDWAFLELGRSRDSNSIGRIIVGGLRAEISAKGGNCRSAVISFWRYLEGCRLTLSMQKEFGREYIYWMEYLRRNHDYGGKLRGYRR